MTHLFLLGELRGRPREAVHALACADNAPVRLVSTAETHLLMLDLAMHGSTNSSKALIVSAVARPTCGWHLRHQSARRSGGASAMPSHSASWSGRNISPSNTSSLKSALRDG